MVARLLKCAGVHMGDDLDFLPAREEENPAGSWEHSGFHALNERLLIHLGGGWDMADLPGGWMSRDDLEPFRECASRLIERMDIEANGGIAWGWKDPRNSITIQFWRDVLPDLRVVVCVRNPLDVAASLQRRNNFSLAASNKLWLSYYRNIIDNVPEHARIVTCREAWFADPRAELKRVLTKLGLPVNEKTLGLTQTLVNPALQHHHSSLDQLIASDSCPEIIDMYVRLCDAAGANGQGPAPGENFTASLAPLPGESSRGDLARSRFHVEIAQREEHIRRLSNENAALRKSMDDALSQLGALGKEVEKLAGRLDGLLTGRNEDEIRDLKLSTMTERAVAVQQLVMLKNAQFTSLQHKVESTLKETKPMLPRALRFSNSINSVYRIIKRVRKLGKLFTLQRELNNAINESLGTLTHISMIMTNHRGDMTGVPAGLEEYGTGKIPMDVSQLMAFLRIRLS